MARCGPDEQADALDARGGADLVADALEDRRDRAFEELEADVAGEPVADDDVAGSAEDVPALHIAAGVELALREQGVRLERELVAPLGLLADREPPALRVIDLDHLVAEDGAHLGERSQVRRPGIGLRTRVAEHAGP